VPSALVQRRTYVLKKAPEDINSHNLLFFRDLECLTLKVSTPGVWLDLVLQTSKQNVALLQVCSETWSSSLLDLDMGGISYGGIFGGGRLNQQKWVNRIKSWLIFKRKEKVKSPTAETKIINWD